MSQDGDAAAAAAPAAEAEAPADPVKEMRTITLTGYGGLKNVKCLNKPEVTPKEGEVLVRIRACGLNFADLQMRQGVIDSPPKTPFTMGFECAGEVEALGENVDGFKPGDKVIGLVDTGAWSELVCIPAQFLYKMPKGMSYQDGAAIIMNYVTAYVLLFELGNVKKGQSLLVHSAGGGVGHAICQLVRLTEDITIFGTASYNKHEQVKSMVDHIFDHVVDYNQEIRKIAPEGVDLVLDCLCGEDTNRGINLLKPMGKYVLYGTSNIVTGETKSFFSLAKSWWQVDKVSPMRLLEENKTLLGFHLRTLLFKQGKHDYIRDILNKLFKMHADGRIRPVIDSTWAFEDVGEAMQKMHDRKNIGKIILDPSQQPKIQTQKSEEGPAENGEKKEEAAE